MDCPLNMDTGCNSIPVQQIKYVGTIIWTVSEWMDEGGVMRLSDKMVSKCIEHIGSADQSVN